MKFHVNFKAYDSNKPKHWYIGNFHRHLLAEHGTKGSTKGTQKDPEDSQPTITSMFNSNSNNKNESNTKICQSRKRKSSEGIKLSDSKEKKNKDLKHCKKRKISSDISCSKSADTDESSDDSNLPLIRKKKNLVILSDTDELTPPRKQMKKTHVSSDNKTDDKTLDKSFDENPSQSSGES